MKSGFACWLESEGVPPDEESDKHGKLRRRQMRGGKGTEEFVHDWITTNRNPCSVCGTDKSKCAFYKELIEKGAIEKGDKQP